MALNGNTLPLKFSDKFSQMLFFFFLIFLFQAFLILPLRRKYDVYYLKTGVFTH